eukprot:COSAG02_NODE_2708_length_8189_cov_3.908282_9_plen_80_part_00
MRCGSHAAIKNFAIRIAATSYSVFASGAGAAHGGTGAIYIYAAGGTDIHICNTILCNSRSRSGGRIDPARGDFRISILC